MNTRIRYGVSEWDPKMLKSKQHFKAKGKDVYVVLNEGSFHYIIFDDKTKEVVSSGGNTRNKTILRLQAKKALETLGVTFEGENRNRKTKKLSKIKAPPQTESSEYMKRDEVMTLLENFTKNLSKEIRTIVTPTKHSDAKKDLAG